MRVVLSLVLLLSVVACVCVGQSTTGLLMGGFRDVEVTRSDVKRAVMVGVFVFFAFFLCWVRVGALCLMLGLGCGGSSSP